MKSVTLFTQEHHCRGEIAKTGRAGGGDGDADGHDDRDIAVKRDGHLVPTRYGR